MFEWSSGSVADVRWKMRDVRCLGRGRSQRREAGRLVVQWSKWSRGREARKGTRDRVVTGGWGIVQNSESRNQSSELRAEAKRQGPRGKTEEREECRGARGQVV